MTKTLPFPFTFFVYALLLTPPVGGRNGVKIISLWLIIAISGLVARPGAAQNIAINNNGAAPSASAMLDASSTTQGVLIPRMTDAQRQALKDPIAGLIIYNTTSNEINFYNGSGWQRVTGDCSSSVSAGGTGPGQGVAVSLNEGSADASAILDISSTDKGLLIPRTAQGSVTPVQGLIIYNNTMNTVDFYNGTQWKSLCYSQIDNNKGTGASAGGIAINVSGNPGNNSAILDVESGSKGVLLPRVFVTERDALATPAQGLIIYNKTDNHFEHWTGSQWQAWSDGCGTAENYSLRFNSVDNASLSRAPASAGNRNTWTFSAWVKRSAIVSAEPLFAQGLNSCNYEVIWFYAPNRLVYGSANSGCTWTTFVQSSAEYRDPSAWYHVVVAISTTQATASDRVKLYVNGTQITSFATDYWPTTYPPQNDNTWINSTGVHYLGREEMNNQYFDGYMHDVYFIDGQALTPSSFGQTNATSGEWEPKTYSGAYGTNGFHLDFKDSSPASDLGKDVSVENNNDFTVNNIDATDQVIDIPANNFCTLNPIDAKVTSYAGATLSNGNIYFTDAGVYPKARGTFKPNTGKWYMEIKLFSAATSFLLGLSEEGAQLDDFVGYRAGEWSVFLNNGCARYNNNSNNSSNVSSCTWSTGDALAMAWDMDSKKVWWGRIPSGSTSVTWFNSGNPSAGTNPIYSNLTDVYPTVGCGENGVSVDFSVHFGQGGQSGLTYYASAGGYFIAPPPCGFKALCAQNLPTPAIPKSDNYFDALVYSGNGTSITVGGLNFQPDLVWIKNRTVARSHQLYDAVRGVQNLLASNLTQVELNNSAYLTAFNSNGFSAGSDNGINESGTNNLVAWNWKSGNSSGSSNTNGSITSTVSVNTTAGVSIVTYTGTGANATIGHGLGNIPEMIIVKDRTGTNNWAVYHTGMNASPQSGYMLLNNTNSFASDNTYWNNTTPTSSVFSIGTNADVNTNGNNYVTYAFSEVEGYSKMGSYTGNGSTDGPFVWCGFKPAFIMVKKISAADGWVMHDSKRSPYNQANNTLRAEDSGAESGTVAQIDFLSNGFKIRNTNNEMNTSGGSYIFMAFAEVPFKYANAR